MSKGYYCIAGKCLNTLNGTYSCVDDSSSRTIISAAEQYRDSTKSITNNRSSYVHVVVSVDHKLLDGLVAMVQSVIEHTGNNDVMIHIVVNTDDELEIRNRVTCSISLPDNVKVSVPAMKIFTN